MLLFIAADDKVEYLSVNVGRRALFTEVLTEMCCKQNIAWNYFFMEHIFHVCNNCLFYLFSQLTKMLMLRFIQVGRKKINS